MNIFRIILLGLIFPALIAQDETSSKIYWNSLSTAVNVGVPLADDESLRGGRIQIRVSFDGGKNFSNIANPFDIEKGDIDDLKEVSIPAELFESMVGFKEGGEVQFIAEIWDKAGNSVVGTVSDSVLTIDETIPTVVSLSITSSNSHDPNLAMDDDSLTLDFVTSEPIDLPIFEINGDEFEPVGFEKSWKTIYQAEEADDGPITFEIKFNDLAGNPGVPISLPTDKKIITKDGTPPELDDVNLFSSNAYDSTLAVKGDTVFLQFTATEKLQNIQVELNSVESEQFNLDSLTFTYYHVFTESDSEGVIPIAIDYSDLAGNLGEQVDETSDDSEVTYDMTPPADFKVETVGSLQGEKIERVNVDESDSLNVQSDSRVGLSTFSQLYVMVAAGVLGFFCLLIWISWFKIFSKAGQAGWKALVPFFNLFILAKIVQKPVWWIAIYLIVPVGWILVALQISKVFGKKVLYAIGLIFLPFVFYPLLAFGKSQYGEASAPIVPKKEKKSKKKKKK